MTIAFVYPGQGSLSTGMLGAWRDTPSGAIVDQIADAAGLDLWALDDDADSGARTAVAQPAIFAASLAAHTALVQAGAQADVVAGHSLGELSATVAAGSLTLDDTASLVAERGRAMGDACAAEPGAMAAVLKLDIERVEAAVASVDGAAVANDNADGQVVVSGPPEAIEQVVARLRDDGARVLPLDVEGAFHSPAMAPAVVRVDALLRRLPVVDPVTPLLSGTTGERLADADAVHRALVEGVLAPVRWRGVQRSLAALDVELLVEVGPGRVLAGIAKRALRGVDVVNVGAPGDVGAAVDAIVATRDARNDRSESVHATAG